MFQRAAQPESRSPQMTCNGPISVVLLLLATALWVQLRQQHNLTHAFLTAVAVLETGVWGCEKHTTVHSAPRGRGA